MSSRYKLDPACIRGLTSFGYYCLGSYWYVLGDSSMIWGKKEGYRMITELGGGPVSGVTTECPSFPLLGSE